MGGEEGADLDVKNLLLFDVDDEAGGEVGPSIESSLSFEEREVMGSDVIELPFEFGSMRKE